MRVGGKHLHSKITKVQAAADLASGFAGCRVCRDPNTVETAVRAGDTTPDHVVEAFADPSGKPVARYRVYKDGILIADQPDVLGASVTVPPSSGSYRLLVSLDRRVNQPRLSTASTLDPSRGLGSCVPRSSI